MNQPQMILFDYAHTLAWSPVTDFVRGERALFQHVTENPFAVTPEDASRLGTEIWLKQRDARHGGVEIHEHQQLRLKYDALGLKFDLPMDELEKLLWAAASEEEPMPGAKAMLAALRRMGIRTGVISNLGWSCQALTERLTAMLDHEFEMVLVSSEYGMRKPDPLLFRAALGKAALQPEDVWFCGDQIEADVYGAQNVGIFPVWYDNLEIPNGFSHKNAGLTIDGPGLHIHHWSELLQALEACEA